MKTGRRPKRKNGPKSEVTTKNGKTVGVRNLSRNSKSKYYKNLYETKKLGR